MTIVTTWDGVEFGEMDKAEAEKLEKADKLQIISTGFVDGMSLKYRNQFTGYKTREMRAEQPAKKVEKPAEQPKKPAPAAAKAKKKTATKKKAK